MKHLCVSILLALCGLSIADNGEMLSGSSISKLSADIDAGANTDTDGATTLNVHVVPHTHDDVGWLKTVEQYYYGLNQSITERSVRSILDSVVVSLMQNPARTFTYVESKFFSMWWNEQSDVIKDSVRFLIYNNQLSFANGGWCMHDEASTHFVGMIDQTTLGHRMLYRELGVVPKVGWQLDPFGHSATQASLFTSRLGFDALYFGRIDYQDLAWRRMMRECEGLWASSKSWTDESVFWALTGSYYGNYGCPRGFCFDILCPDPPLIGMNKTTFDAAILHFLREIRRQSDATKGNHIMLTMGEDFNYQKAEVNFANMDMLISVVMNKQHWKQINVPAMFGPRFDCVNIFYSSPDYYTECKYKELSRHRRSSNGDDSHVTDSLQLSEKTDDFMPYSDCAHCFWTGYFTSRSAFKRLERVASSMLMAARQVFSMHPINISDAATYHERLHELDDAVGVAQHHDGVAGTAKQHVAYDYARRVQSGIDSVAPMMAKKLRDLLVLGKKYENGIGELLHCQRLNETICEVSQNATLGKGIDFLVVVYNSLATTRSAIIRIPVSASGDYYISYSNDHSAGYETHRAIPSSSKISKDLSADFVLPYEAILPPLGTFVFQVSMHSSGPTPAPTTMSSATLLFDDDFTVISSLRGRQVESAESGGRDDHDEDGIAKDDDHIVISNRLITVHFEKHGPASIKQVTTANGDTFPIEQTWGYYEPFDNTVDKGCDGDNDDRCDQNSGAYVFRPSTPEQEAQILQPVSSEVFEGTSGSEFHIGFGNRQQPWIRSVTRAMTANVPYVEVEYTVGPIPVEDGRGKEVITRICSKDDGNGGFGINNRGVFYTDSNGREFMRRKINERPTWALNVYEPIAGNFYPVNAGIYIEGDDDENNKRVLAILVDRSVGGASLQDGCIELLIQRRTLVDDARGVDEALNETSGGMSAYPPYGNATRSGDGVVVRGTILIFVGHTLSQLTRTYMDRVFAEPQVFVAPIAPGVEVMSMPTVSGIQDELPPNVMLVTFQLLYDGDSGHSNKFLVRLAHQYGVGEHPDLSQSVQVDLSTVFAGYTVESVIEKTLAGNEDYNDFVKRRFDWKGTGFRPSSLDGTVVTLQAMDVLTFEVTMSASS